jgi:anthranilate phosphoribosyltransferase
VFVVISTLLAQAIQGHRLSRQEMAEAVTQMLEGRATSVQVGALLAVLSARGETVDELIGAVLAVRAQAQMISVKQPIFVDTCGTGGDGAGTFNISTAAAIVTAACGVTVAKHGNRSVSSKCGSADVLAALGANIELSPAQVEACIASTRLGFLFAPAHHPAFRHVAAVRRELGVRTLFNLVGPLSNPAGSRRQVIGVFDPKWVPLVAEAVAALGVDHALIVHGEGLDEFSVSGETQVEEVRGHERKSYRVTPESVGLNRSDSKSLLGGSAEENASILRAVLHGAVGPRRDVVLFNTAGALLVAGRVDSLAEGVALAGQAIDFGAAERTLGQFVRFTNNAFTTLDTIVTSAEPEALIADERRASTSLFASLSGANGPLRVVAEVKRASPSAGVIADIADPVALAVKYSQGGAAGISVLTESRHFGGSLADLRAVCGAVGLAPTLRKEFVTQPSQITNARRVGASAVLLIAAVLGSKLKLFIDLCRRAELDALVEVHDASELDQAIEGGSTIIGINHRDLRTFEIDLGLSSRLIPRIPSAIKVVCESGVRSLDDAKRLRDGGATNLLVGELLVRSNDPGALIQAIGAL